MTDKIHALERRSHPRGQKGLHLAWGDAMTPPPTLSDGSMVEFWCHRMSKRGRVGTGIRGWFRGGLFWSHDNADHYAPSEVTHWINMRNSIVRCQYFDDARVWYCAGCAQARLRKLAEKEPK